MREHRVSIFGYEDSLLALGPGRLGVGGERQVGRIADPNYIEQIIAAAEIVAQHGLPERSADVFVENKCQRHALTDLRFVRSGPPSGEPAAEGVQVDGHCALLLLVRRDSARRYVGVNFRLVVEVKGDHTVYEGQRQG